MAAPATIERRLVITGGSLSKAWVPQNISYIADQPFLSLSKLDRDLARFIGLDMTQRSPWEDNQWPAYLCKLRKAAVDAELAKAEREQMDPLCDEGAPRKKARKDFMHSIPAVVDIQIPCDGVYHTMSVLSCQNNRTMVSFELTATNLDVLCKAMATDPPMDELAAKRVMSCVADPQTPDIRWKPDTNQLYCYYVDDDGKKKKHQRQVPVCSEHDAQHVILLEHAKAMQEFFNENNKSVGGDEV